MTNKRVFAKFIALAMAVALVVSCCFALVACNKKKDEPKTVADIYKSKTSEGEFSSFKHEFTLDEGCSVYVSSGTSYQAVDVKSDVGYIESLDAFVIVKDGFLSLIKCGDEQVHFTGGMKGQLIPFDQGITALRVKDGLIACKFANGKAGVFNSKGNTVMSRKYVANASSANIDDVIKILDGGLIAVASQYDVSPNTGYTAIYRPTTDGKAEDRGVLACRVKNKSAKLTNVRGFDGKYVSVTDTDGSYMFAIPQNPSEVKNLNPTTNGLVEDNGKDDYYSEITYIGNGKFFIHEDWTVESTDEYSYYDGFDYYVFQRRIYTPDNDASKQYTDNADKVFLYLENAYYGGDKGGIDTRAYLKNGFTYASYGLSIIGKLGTYDQYILDENLNVVMSLSGNYGVTIKEQKKEKVGYFDLVMQCVDGYYYNPVQPSEVNVYDKDGNKVGHNERTGIAQQELTNNVIIAAATDPDDEDSYLFGAYNVYGDLLIPFEYTSISAFRGAYTIGERYQAESRKKERVILGADGKVVTEMSDGSVPLADMAYTKSDSSGVPIYKIGCYMYFVKSKDADGKEINLFGIKNFNPNVNKNVVMPATMQSGSVLYSSSKSPQNVFVFDKVTVGTSVSYTIYRLI